MNVLKLLEQAALAERADALNNGVKSDALSHPALLRIIRDAQQAQGAAGGEAKAQNDPPIRQLVLAWHGPGLRWMIVSLHEDGFWHFQRDVYLDNVPKKEFRFWIELPSPPTPCIITDEDEARGAGTPPATSPQPAQPVGGDADTVRDVLMGKSLRQYAQDLRIKACGAWSGVVKPPYAGLDEAQCQVARALEERLKAAIDELADLSCHTPAAQSQGAVELSENAHYWLMDHGARGEECEAAEKEIRTLLAQQAARIIELQRQVKS